MSSAKFQETFERIESTGQYLLQYLEELQNGEVEIGKDNHSLDNLQEQIKKTLNALNQQTYQVAVIAAMKAGKSTFLNALIGADILASESESCTVCRTDIRPVSETETPRLLEYRTGERKPFLLAEGDAETIRKTFLDRTHKIRRTNNEDAVTRFELQHPIEAIQEMPSLNGFTLVDTPGPNEWEAADFSTVELKATAYEALRTCDAILFILDYSSFKDNTNSELLDELIAKREETLQRNTDKLYFIFNKVDMRSEKDRPVEEVMKDLENTLISFGIPKPSIYPASAWKGLLGKLIQSREASKDHKKDFKDKFLGSYIEEDEEGDLIVPKLADIAPTAIEDSGIKGIEDSVITTVVNNSGWNLLNDALVQFDKAAKAIEDSLNTRIRGWELEIESLRDQVAKYKEKADITQQKVKKINESVDIQKKSLIEGFSKGIDFFSQKAKSNIENELKGLIDQLITEQTQPSPSKEDNSSLSQLPIPKNPKQDFVDFGKSILEFFPRFGKGLGIVFEATVDLGYDLFTKLQNESSDSFLEEVELKISKDRYILVFNNQDYAEKTLNSINNYCQPLLQSWWIGTQDKLVSDGNLIRNQLVDKIQRDIQTISDELSDYLGNSLEINLNINPIEFPSFDFSGIDAKIQEQQEIYQVKEKVTKYKKESQGFCKRDQTVPYQVEETRDQYKTSYEIDVNEILRLISEQIDNQTKESKTLLERVINKQVNDDFKSADKQIQSYINQFHQEFDNLLKEREKMEEKAPQIREQLKAEKQKLSQYQEQINAIQADLATWQPKTSKVKID